MLRTAGLKSRLNATWVSLPLASMFTRDVTVVPAAPFVETTVRAVAMAAASVVAGASVFAAALALAPSGFSSSGLTAGQLFSTLGPAAGPGAPMLIAHSTIC